MATTVYDIARAAGVGRTTVLRALWDKEHINPETKARIKKIAAEMNYRPNFIARSLVQGRSRFIGVLVTPSIFPSSPGTVDVSRRCAGGLQHAVWPGGYPGGEARAQAWRDAGWRGHRGACVQHLNPMLPAVVESGVSMVVIDRRREISAPGYR